MVQLGERKGFFAEPFSGSVVSEHAEGQNLKGHVAIELLVVSAVDHAHSAGADLLENDVVSESLADEMGRDGHFAGNGRPTLRYRSIRDSSVSSR